MILPGLNDKLTDDFSLHEFTQSQIAKEKNIDNTPKDDKVISNIYSLCVYILQPLRNFYSTPVVITSGYRCPELNNMIGGAKNSYHQTGLAADIVVPDVKHLTVFESMRLSKLPIKELIFYHGRHIHVAWRKGGYNKDDRYVGVRDDDAGLLTVDETTT